MNRLFQLLLSMSKPKKPTHAVVTRFVESYLPLKENDVQRLYHVPRNSCYDADTAVVEQVVLSVTPTPGVYSFIAPVPHTHPRPPRTLCFLHRPFNLDRRNVRKGTLVLSSHSAFDEVLTVGWNTALAERLGMDIADCVCVQGYRGDPERKIGIVGKVSVSLDEISRRTQDEFGASELALAGKSDEIRIIAIMNAFNEDEVHRILDTARGRGWIVPEQDGRQVLYLTGQPRSSGLEAAKALGISVACVGHRQAEDWGIRYMAEELRRAFPNTHIEEVYEEETLNIRAKKEVVVEEIEGQ